MPSATQEIAARRVLVLEDHPLIGMLLAEMLVGMGHVVCGVAASEQEGVAIAAAEHPDLIIADAGLEAGSGVEAIKRILQTGWVPHVVMSGNVALLKALGPDAVVLLKPFDERALVRCIDRAIRAVPVSLGS